MDYRVYFNRKNEKPQIWSVDEGHQTSEINVSHWMLHQLSAEDGGDLSVEPNPDTPTVWIKILHSLPVRVINGTAHFFHDPDWRLPKIDRDARQRLDETP